MNIYRAGYIIRDKKNEKGFFLPSVVSLSTCGGVYLLLNVTVPWA